VSVSYKSNKGLSYLSNILSLTGQKVGEVKNHRPTHIHIVYVEGVEEFAYLGSKQTADGYMSSGDNVTYWPCLCCHELAKKCVE